MTGNCVLIIMYQWSSKIFCFRRESHESVYSCSLNGYFKRFGPKLYVT